MNFICMLINIMHHSVKHMQSRWARRLQMNPLCPHWLQSLWIICFKWMYWRLFLLIMSASRAIPVTSQCLVLGASKKKLRTTVLPTYGEILRSYLHMRETSFDVKWTQARNRLFEDVIGIWYSASLPTLSERRINAMFDK